MQEDNSALKAYFKKSLGVVPTDETIEEIEAIILVRHTAQALKELLQEDSKALNGMTKLSKGINAGNREKGFWDDYEKYKEFEPVKTAFISQFIMLVNTELSEAVERMRKEGFKPISKYCIEYVEKYKEEFKTTFEFQVKDRFEDEIADAIIRLLDIAGGLKIDIGWHVAQKLKYNNLRKKMHGKKF